MCVYICVYVLTVMHKAYIISYGYNFKPGVRWLQAGLHLVS